jgi:hypothetical protein
VAEITVNRLLRQELEGSGNEKGLQAPAHGSRNLSTISRKSAIESFAVGAAADPTPADSRLERSNDRAARGAEPGMIRFVLFSFLLLWFLFTVLLQIGMVLRLRRPQPDFVPAWAWWDFLRVLPRWVLFAAPPTQDHSIFYRDRDRDDQYTAWRQVLIEKSPPSYSWIWNPNHFRAKVIEDCSIDLMNALIARINHEELDVQQCIPYQCLKVCVAGLKRSPLCTARQFLITRSCGDQSPVQDQIVFVSPEFSPSPEDIEE